MSTVNNNDGIEELVKYDLIQGYMIREQSNDTRCLYCPPWKNF